MVEHIIPAARFVIRDNAGRFFNSNAPHMNFAEGFWGHTRASIYTVEEAQKVMEVHGGYAEQVRVA